MSVQRIIQAGGPINGANELVDIVLNESTGVSRSGTAAAIINGTTAPEYRSYGRFLNGQVASGTALPSLNQNGGSAVYSGGIGFPQGICLCTGFSDDADPTQSTSTGLGKGVQGPNNGQPFTTGGSPSRGEADYDFSKPADNDALQALGIGNGVVTGDAAVLDFGASLSKPGILIVRYVAASDEFPEFTLETYNDSPTVLWRNALPGTTYKNLIVFRKNNGSGGIMELPFSLDKLNACGFLKHNQVAPAPSPLAADSRLQTNSVNLYFDHEYGGFSKIMRVEMAKAVPPGSYQLKFAIQDIADRKLDSSVFFPDNGMRLFTFRQGDFNRDGAVDAADYTVWADNWGQSGPDVTFEEGDGNADLTVDSADYTLWVDNFGLVGNIDYCADFNRDGYVDDMDETMLNTYLATNITECASRFEGDANEDGAVDQCDYDIWQYEFDTGVPLRPCACESGGMARSAGGNDLATSCLEAVLIDKAARAALKANQEAYRQSLQQAAEAIRSELPKSPDTNGDGAITAADLAAIEAIVAKHLEKALAAAGVLAPTLAPPERVAVDEEGESP